MPLRVRIEIRRTHRGTLSEDMFSAMLDPWVAAKTGRCSRHCRADVG